VRACVYRFMLDGLHDDTNRVRGKQPWVELKVCITGTLAHTHTHTHTTHCRQNTHTHPSL
jgi:hypothetical protein